MTETKVKRLNFKEVTADIVSAYLSRNHVRTADLPDLIASIHGAVVRLALPPLPPPQVPPVKPERSVQPDHIVCLEDGKKFISLKQHLAKSHGMTPEKYRAKWDLADDYPMVAPNHSAKRSQIAKRIGLGGRR